MRRSDIFEDFVKIAEDKGLLSGTTHEEAKRKLEENSRMDSLDTTAIEALYGVKPDTPKGMEYEKNIAEIAHPNAVVVSPSYDKINGLVENINERQNIIMNIVDATPDGVLRNRKYAQQEFITSLVRVANDLDNKGHDDLRVLADTCLKQMATQKKTFEKRAFWGMGVGASVAVIAVPIALTLGAIYVQQHLKFINDGVQKNYEKLSAELGDMLTSNSNWGVGQEYTQQFHQQLLDFKNRLDTFHRVYKSIIPVIESLETPKSGKELMKIMNQPETQQVIKAVKKLDAASDNFFDYLDMTQKNFKNETYKLRQIKEKGVLTRFVDWTRFLHGGLGLIADDFDDVVRAIGPYKESIADTIDMLTAAKSVQYYAQNQVLESGSRVNEPKTTSPTKKRPSKPGRENTEEIERELAELNEQIPFSRFQY